MHEMSLMASVFEIADRQLADIPVKRVLKVKLQVGKLANALEDALQLAFDAFSQGTVYQGARLEMETVPATWRCDSCGLDFTADVGAVTCPNCNGMETRLIGGRDLILQSLEVE